MTAPRLGIFGGTFDPPHLGHLLVAETAREELALDQVLFMLAPQPPHKSVQVLTPWPQRLAMLQNALSDHPQFIISTLEAQRSGPSYTVDTLRALRKLPEFEHAQLYLLLGQDSMSNFHTWREPETIRQLATVAIYPRHETHETAAPLSLPANCLLLNAPIIAISSSEVRRRVARQQSIRYLVPENVREYIATQRLYHQEA
ncbi:MAG: nicotinate-nucleotide adenylyltransferase [candidate division KSB1 bacterium]